MRPDVVRVLRARLRPRHLWPHVGAVAVAGWLTGDALTTLGVAGGLALVETLDVLEEAGTVDGRLIQGGAGLVAAAVGIAWLGYDVTAGAVTVRTVFPALAVLAGGWLVLDARVAAGDERTTAEADLGDALLLASHVRRVATALDDGPKTVDELAEQCGLSEARVHEVIEMGTTDDVIVRVDGGEQYALDESNTGVGAFLRLNLARAGRRLTQPFTG